MSVKRIAMIVALNLNLLIPSVFAANSDPFIKTNFSPSRPIQFSKQNTDNGESFEDIIYGDAAIVVHNGRAIPKKWLESETVRLEIAIKKKMNERFGQRLVVRCDEASTGKDNRLEQLIICLDWAEDFLAIDLEELELSPSIYMLKLSDQFAVAGRGPFPELIAKLTKKVNPDLEDFLDQGTKVVHVNMRGASESPIKIINFLKAIK